MVTLVTARAGEFGVCIEKISCELCWGLHHVRYLDGWLLNLFKQHLCQFLSAIFKLYAPLGKWIYLPIAWLKECIRKPRFGRTIVGLHSFTAWFILVYCSEIIDCIFFFYIRDLYKVDFAYFIFMP